MEAFVFPKRIFAHFLCLTESSITTVPHIASLVYFATFELKTKKQKKSALSCEQEVFDEMLMNL